MVVAATCCSGSREAVCVYTAEFGFWLEVLLDCAGRVDGIVFFGGVLAGELEDDLGSARVFGEEVGNIVDISVENDPAAVCGSVLRN